MIFKVNACNTSSQGGSVRVGFCNQEWKIFNTLALAELLVKIKQNKSSLQIMLKFYSQRRGDKKALQNKKKYLKIHCNENKRDLKHEAVRGKVEVLELSVFERLCLCPKK